ncbi:MAG: hypothetical protein FWG55_02220 [Candidatus Bathyarchaeota archaeon]|nr:hypothetical protein [Candidatus Termiticorpusculum sp.]
MRYIKKFSTILLLAALICSFAALPATYAATSKSNQEKALSFVTNVIPFDTTKYDITLTNHINGPPSEWDSYDRETFDYTLKSNENTLIASCSFQDNILTYCLMMSPTEPVSQYNSDKNLVNVAKIFIENYQTFTGEKLTDMLNTLSNADSTKNMTATSGDIKLQISNIHLDLETIRTQFMWTITINNVDYTTLSIGFDNDIFNGFMDNRGLFEIGNPDVSITHEQAVNLALKYIETYSYKGLAGTADNPQTVDISGFKVVKDLISSKLSAFPYETTCVLYPYYSVQLPLEELYPGNVWALSVYVWAGSGDVFFCQPLGYGGIIDDTVLQPSNTDSTAIPQNQNMLIIGIAIVTTITVATTGVLITKKKQK